jgi:hypothetical protein
MKVAKPEPRCFIAASSHDATLKPRDTVRVSSNKARKRLMRRWN